MNINLLIDLASIVKFSAVFIQADLLNVAVQKHPVCGPVTWPTKTWAWRVVRWAGCEYGLPGLFRNTTPVEGREGLSWQSGPHLGVSYIVFYQQHQFQLKHFRWSREETTPTTTGECVGSCCGVSTCLLSRFYSLMTWLLVATTKKRVFVWI